MKSVCLIGEYSKANWPGSATNKVQRYVAQNLMLSGKKVTVYELPPIKGKIRKLFSKTKISCQNNIEIVQGGALRIITFLFKGDFDVIHFIVTRKYMLASLPVLPFVRSKIISTFHDTLIFSEKVGSINRYLDYFLYRLLLFFSNKIFIYNNLDFVRVNKFSKNKAILMKNGVDAKFFSPCYNKKPLNEVVFASGLGKVYKGLKFLEEALLQVREKFSFIICGENAGQQENSNYIGPIGQEDFRNLLQKSCLLIVPSEYDAFSINGLEAMACGTPIIITKNCGLANYLKDGEGCFVIDYGDIKQLSNRISLLLSDKLLQERMSYKAREIAENFSWQNIVHEYISQYEN